MYKYLYFILVKSIAYFAFSQTLKRRNCSDSGIVEAFIARSTGWLRIKPCATLLGACLIVEEIELLFETCVDGNTFGYFDGDFIILI